MTTSDMLHWMCRGGLAATDIKAICKSRGLMPEANSAPGVLETLFLSNNGLSDAFGSLEPKEISLLYLMKNTTRSIDASFFGRVYGGDFSYGTFNQKYQNAFAKVKERLIRRGVLLFAEARVANATSKMERWRFALPTEFHSHLPPLLNSPRPFDGDGDWRPNVVADKLCSDIAPSSKKTGDIAFQLEKSELRLDGHRFAVAKLLDWQLARWNQLVPVDKKTNVADPYSKTPAAAAYCILSELDDKYWSSVEQLAEPLRLFCGKKVEVEVVCNAGVEAGLLAKRQADGKPVYRLAPQRSVTDPEKYVTPNNNANCVSVDLNAVPFDALEKIVAISDQRADSATKRSLLVSPNFVKLGRAGDDLLASDAVQWLVENTKPFAETYVALSDRRGKTVLHEKLFVARVNDLSLKVALEKALGSELVSLKNDFVAFPRGSINAVMRVVNKLGHVVKEVHSQ